MAPPIDFAKVVIERSHHVPVLVDFWAPWCAPCRVLGPVLDALATRFNGRFELIKVNVDENPEVARTYRTASIPAVKLFAQGTIAAEFVGALPEREIVRWLEQHLPSPAKNAFNDGIAAQKAGDRALARTCFEKAVAEDPTLAAAKLALGAELMTSGNRADVLRAQEVLQQISPNAPEYADAEHALTLASVALSDTAQAPEGSTPSDWQTFVTGAAAMATGDYAKALDSWLELVRLRRRFDNDLPKRAVVAVFRLLGDEHPLTQQYRRALSSALY